MVFFFPATSTHTESHSSHQTKIYKRRTETDETPARQHYSEQSLKNTEKDIYMGRARQGLTNVELEIGAV
jgi:hypothetical protein